MDTQWRSGFFADDAEAAINEYWRYLASNPPRVPNYVSGSVIHEDRANCYSLPQVNRKHYRAVERKRYNTNWTQYHLWERSCWTWADEVTRDD